VRIGVPAAAIRVTNVWRSSWKVVRWTPARSIVSFEDVRRWAQSQFDVALAADRTAVFGVSASAELALAIGLRHPDIYGVVLCASPGAGYRPPAVMPSSLPRAHLVAGMQEPFFLENATRWADALRDAGAEIVVAQRVRSHGDAFRREEFPADAGVGVGR
jgi:pimeloyl-ACP methyl ester carboxylesterase